MNKRIAKNTLYLYLRMMFSMAVSFYTSRVVLATLGVEDYGIYNVVGGVIGMFSFLRASMGTAASRFLTFALGKEDREEFQKTFSAALTIHILIALFIFVLAETAGLWFLENKLVIASERMHAARIVYQLSILSTMASIIQVPYDAAIIAHERMHIFAYIEILNTCLKLGIVFLLFIGLWDKLILYAVLLFAVSCIIAGVYRLYCIKQFKECRYKYEWNQKVIYPMLNFSGWDLIGNGAYIGATQGVNVILNLFFGTLVNAAHGVASMVNTATISFVRNFQTAVNPQIVKLYAVGKIDELHGLLFQNAKFSFSLIWLLLLPVSLNLETLLQIWLVEVPEYAALFCRLVLLQSIISCVQRPFVMAIHATGKMKPFQLSAGTVLLSVLPISYFFLKAGGAPYIPFLVYIGASALELLVELYLLRRWINLSFRHLIKTVFIPVLFVIVCTLPISVLAGYYLHFLLAIAFSGILVCISIYFITFDKETRINIIRLVMDIFNIHKFR